MKKTVLCIIFLFLVILSLNVKAVDFSPFFYNKKLEVLDITVQDDAFAGESFPVYITIQNNRIFPVIVSVRVDLLNGALECIKKEIGIDQYMKLGAKQVLELTINCIVREGDIDWYKEEYNIRAVLYRELDLLGRRIPADESTTMGIHINSPFHEKEKIRICDAEVPDFIEENEQDEIDFKVKIILKNGGHYNFNSWVRVDLIEKPSAVPELENFIDITGLSSVRKEIGHSDYFEIRPGCYQTITIPCELRRSEITKEKLNIQAVCFVNIEGKVYQVDASTLYSIYHDQPFCRDEWCWIIVIAGFFTVLFCIAIIAIIFRIIYPRYYRRRIEIRDEYRSLKARQKERELEEIKKKSSMKNKK
jgi:hypothetical protein